MIKERIYKAMKVNRVAVAKSNFAPSSITACRRKLYYRGIGELESNPPNEAAKVKFCMGNAVHLAIQKILKADPKIEFVEMEDFKEKEIDGLKFIYRLDYSMKMNIPFIIEIKSTYMAGWQMVEKEPKQEHVDQLVTYMMLESIDAGVLLYIGRDNGFMVEYNFVLTKKMRARFWNRIAELKKVKSQIENKQLPERDYEICLKNTGEKINTAFTKNKVRYKSDWQCSYCSYRDICWADEFEAIKDHKFYINGVFSDE